MKDDTPIELEEIVLKKEDEHSDSILIVNNTETTFDTHESDGFDIHYASNLHEASKLAEDLEECLVLGTLKPEKKIHSGTAFHMEGIAKVCKSLQSALTTVQEAMSKEAARLVKDSDSGTNQLGMISTVNKSLQEALMTVYKTMNDESDRLVEKEEADTNYVIKPFEDARLAERLSGILNSSIEVTELQEENLRLESLVSIITSVLTSLNIADIRSVIVNKLAEAIQTKDCSVLLLKKDYDECFVLDSAKELPNSELRVDLNNYPELKRCSIRKSLLP